MTRRKHDRKAKLTNRPEPTPWQAQVLRDLTDVATRQPDDLRLVSKPEVIGGDIWSLRIELCTKVLERAAGGVKFRAWEPFTISVPDDDLRPPSVQVEHDRFLGVAHVMSGYELCLYLDISREWDPCDGVRGVLNRLWQWLADAAADRFDPDTALYHAVGGVSHLTDGTPTVVVRSLPDPGPRVANMYLHARSNDRLDLSAARANDGDLHVPVFRLHRDLRIGAGQDVLADLLSRLEYTQGPRPADWATVAPTPANAALVRVPHRLAQAWPRLSVYAVAGPASTGRSRLPLFTPPWDMCPRNLRLTPPSPSTELAKAILDSVIRNPTGSHQYVMLTVPHPNGGPRHLLCLRLLPRLADILRTEMAKPGVTVDPLKVVANSPHMTMEWCRVSDERAQVTTRRDVGRPANVLVDRVIHIWGVGGIGSWVAEFVARAGARRIVVHDPGRITGGLLVRQNYVEDDIGKAKAEALVARLRSIRDDLDVMMLDTSSPEMFAELVSADLLIDATVSRTVSRFLDVLALTPGRRTTIAQVATDTRSGSLGIATVCAPVLAEPDIRARDSSTLNGTGRPDGVSTLTEIDTAAGRAVAAAAELEPYRIFWAEPAAGDELVPTRGCSVPTFHGSAADLAAVAGGLLNLIARHLGQTVSGTHLISLPHSGVTPAHAFLPHTCGKSSERTRNRPAPSASAGVLVERQGVADVVGQLGA